MGCDGPDGGTVSRELAKIKLDKIYSVIVKYNSARCGGPIIFIHEREPESRRKLKENET
jgi:hypothetical protein